MPTTINDRVRSLIDRLGLTQREFAEQVGLDNPKLSKSLAGVRRFSSVDLARIAELSGVTVDWLVTGASSGLGLAARVSDSSNAERAIVEAERLVEARANLAFLGYAQAWVSLPTQTSGGYEAVGQALAREARSHLLSQGLEVAAADLLEVVERGFGADVAVSDLGSGFDGLSAAQDGARVIVLSRSKVPWRQRFTLAHELGHLLAEDDQGLHLDVDIFDRQHAQLDSERRANSFASSLLMPEEILRDAGGPRGFDRSSFAHLSARLRVSPSALAFRLQRLRLIDAREAHEYKSLTAQQVAQLSDSAAELAEQIATAQRSRLPGKLTRDALSAYTAGATTINPYAQLLGVDPGELRLTLESSGDSGADL